jgi:hypothetical protein
LNSLKSNLLFIKDLKPDDRVQPAQPGRRAFSARPTAKG